MPSGYSKQKLLLVDSGLYWFSDSINKSKFGNAIIPFRPQPIQVFPKSKLCFQSQNGSELHAAPLPKPILAAALRGTLLQAQVIREAACPFRISQTLQFLQMQGGNTSPQTCKTAHSAKKQQSGTTFSKLQRPKLQKLSELTLISFNLQSSPTLQPTLSFQSLKAYAQQLVKQVYEHDSFGVGRLMLQFLGDLGKLRERVQQRLALLAYESESLQFKPFGQVEREMVKQWRRNVLLVALNTIWATRVQGCQFSSLQHFIDQYRKQIALVCNLTHFYFKPALVILDRKSVATFCYLQQQTAHKILNALENWPQIYRHKLLPLIRTQNLEQQFLMDLAYDPAQLSISPLYLNLHSPHPQLLSTTHKIKQFAHQCTIHGKIQLLRQIRATFLEEIEQSRDQIQRSRGEIGQQHPRQHSPLEKDDIIGCMIYCIVTGKVKQIQGSVQSLSELLGANNQALSRRGVDSYRADLQSAVGYLCQQTEVHLITGHKPMEQEQIQLKINNKTTQLDDCG